MTIRDLEPTALADVVARASHAGGHAHFYERAMSRRGFFTAAAGAGAALAAGGLVKPMRAFASGSDAPKPIPGGIVVGNQGWHVAGPGYNTSGMESSGLAEQSTIYDFNGAIATAIVRGKGTGRQGGAVLPLVFDSDMRFMRGKYVAEDGRVHTGTFGFI